MNRQLQALWRFVAYRFGELGAPEELPSVSVLGCVSAGLGVVLKTYWQSETAPAGDESDLDIKYKIPAVVRSYRKIKAAGGDKQPSNTLEMVVGGGSSFA